MSKARTVPQGTESALGTMAVYPQRGLLHHLPQGTGGLSTLGGGRVPDRELRWLYHCRPSLLNWSDKLET